MKNYVSYYLKPNCLRMSNGGLSNSDFREFLLTPNQNKPKTKTEQQLSNRKQKKKFYKELNQKKNNEGDGYLFLALISCIII